MVYGVVVSCLCPSASRGSEEVVKTTVGSNTGVVAWYSQGSQYRSESSSSAGQITIVKNGTMYILDTRSRQYVVPSAPGIFAILAGWIARAPRMHESGKTVNVYRDVTDTGERRRQFGQTARHLSVRERRVAEAGACEQNDETITDGWYFTPQHGNSRGTYLLAFDGRICRDRIVEHGSAAAPGFPVTETKKSGSMGAVTREVLEYSTEPLDKSVFRVPGDYTKVDSLPGYPFSWSDRMEMEWSQLVRAAGSWID